MKVKDFINTSTNTIYICDNITHEILSNSDSYFYSEYLHLDVVSVEYDTSGNGIYLYVEY